MAPKIRAPPPPAPAVPENAAPKSQNPTDSTQKRSPGKYLKRAPKAPVWAQKWGETTTKLIKNGDSAPKWGGRNDPPPKSPPKMGFFNPKSPKIAAAFGAQQECNNGPKPSASFWAQFGRFWTKGDEKWEFWGFFGGFCFVLRDFGGKRDFLGWLEFAGFVH